MAKIITYLAQAAGALGLVMGFAALIGGRLVGL